MCVRVNYDEPMGPAVAALHARLRFAVKPALAFLTPAGDVVHVQYARLYPAFHVNAVEMSDWSEALLTMEDLLRLVDTAEARAAEQAATLARLEGRTDAPSVLARARLLAARARPLEAQRALEALLVEAPHVEAGEALAALHAEHARHARAAATYERLLAGHPEHPRAPRWRVESAEQRVLDVLGASREEAGAAAKPVARLTTLVTTIEDEGLAIRARLVLGLAARLAGNQVALDAQLAWLRARLGTAPTVRPVWTPAMLMRFHELALGMTPASQVEAREIVWKLVRTYPDSVETQKAKHGMLGRMALAAHLR